jgi:hypothetical protein
MKPESPCCLLKHPLQKDKRLSSKKQAFKPSALRLSNVQAICIRNNTLEPAQHPAWNISTSPGFMLDNTLDPRFIRASHTYPEAI